MAERLYQAFMPSSTHVFPHHSAGVLARPRLRVLAASRSTQWLKAVRRHPNSQAGTPTLRPIPHLFKLNPRSVHNLIPTTFFCEMSKCDVLKREVNEGQRLFAGKTETKQDDS
jgi:hypothetical protein